MNNVLEFMVSFFASFFDNEPLRRKLLDVIILANSDYIKSLTAEIRRLLGIANDESTPPDAAISAKNEAAKKKQKLPAFMTNVYCEHGKCRKNIVCFLPFIGFDVDHITTKRVDELMKVFAENQHVIIAAPSVSRHGVHFVVMMDAADWLNSKWDGNDTKPYDFVYQKVKAYVESTFCVDVDPACKNPEHVFGICYDAAIHYKKNPTPLHIDTDRYVAPQAKQKYQPVGANYAGGTYTASLCDVVDTIMKKVEENGCQFAEGQRNDYVLRFAYWCNNYGVAQNEVENFCITNFEASDFSEREIISTIRSAYSKTSEFGKFSATYANTPNANNVEKVVKTTIFNDFELRLADGGMAEVAEKPSETANGYTFTDKLNVEDLPSYLRIVIEKHSGSTAICDAMILGMLNVVSGIMGMANGTAENHCGVYGIYDGRRVYAPVFNIIHSSAGNDKGNLMFCKLLAYPIKVEMRRKYEEEKKKYEEELAEYESKGKKERGPAPKEPAYCDPFVPGNSSSSAVYRALDANGGCGLMFETEADTVTSMINSDYGNYSDLMRKAHHHEPVSMNRVQDKVHIDIDEPRLSVFLTCTSGQLLGLFPSFENGLGSRFLFYYLPDDKVVFHDVFALTKTPLEDTYKDLGNKLLPLYHDMLSRAGHPVQFLMSQSQQKEFLATYSEVLQEQFKMLGKGIRAFIFRMALECFRYGMVLTTLRKLADWESTFNPSDPEQKSIFDEDENGFVCDDRDFHTAMTIMECLINHTAYVYASLAKEDNNPFAHKGLKLTREEVDVYNALPEGDFHTANFIEKAVEIGIAERTAQRMLSNFCNVYRIVNPVRRGVYMKPAKKED